MKESFERVMLRANNDPGQEVDGEPEPIAYDGLEGVAVGSTFTG